MTEQLIATNVDLLKSKFKQSILPTLHNVKRIDSNDGRKYDCTVGIYPSITTVLGSRDNEWLAEWKSRVGEDVAATTSKRAAFIGTAIHALCESYLLNEDTKLSVRKSLPEIAFRFNNFKLFLDDITEVFLLERPVYSTILGIAGTVDCFAMYNGERYVIDFKTSSRLKSKDDIKDYFAQGSFYAYAIAEMYNIEIPKVLIAIAVNGVKEPQIFIERAKDHVQYLLESRAIYWSKHDPS